MEHKLYVVDNVERGSVAGLIQSIADYLGADVRIGYVLQVETDSQNLANAVATVAVANGELLDLYDPAPGDLFEDEFRDHAGADGGEESQPRPVETLEKGEGRLMVVEKPEEEKPKRKPRTYQPRQCDECGQTYTPTGPRSLHPACPGKANGAESQPTTEKPAEEMPAEDKLPAEPPFVGDAQATKPVAQGDTLPPWEDLRTGARYENTELQLLVKEGEFEVGRRFGHREMGVFAVVNRGIDFLLAPIKKPMPAGDRE
jgi:hypothetical protein